MDGEDYPIFSVDIHPNGTKFATGNQFAVLLVKYNQENVPVPVPADPDLDSTFGWT